MAISRKPKTADAAAAFVGGAPDAAGTSTPPATYEKGIAKGHKRQISLTIAPDLLRQVDEHAARAGVGRAAFISMAIYKALEGDSLKISVK